MPDPSRPDPRPAPRERTAHVRRGLLAGAGAVVLAAGLGACGSSAAPSGTPGTGAAGATGAGAAGQARGPGRFFGAARDPKVAACLKKQGVMLPVAPRRPGTAAGGEAGQAGPPPAGVPYGGAGTAVPPAPPAGGPPAGARRVRPGGTAGFQKLRKALASCGVALPARPAAAPGAPSGATPTTPAPPPATTGAATS